MIQIDIPDFGKQTIEHIVLDYNGTMAIDGKLIAGTDELLARLSHDVTVHVVTADTFGKVKKEASGIPCTVSVLPRENQAEAKRSYIERLCADTVAAIGNGRNDRLMLESAAVGIAVVQAEGTAVDTLKSADLIVPDILSALSLFLEPLRLVATLRS